jgi:hypothetical protein
MLILYRPVGYALVYCSKRIIITEENVYVNHVSADRTRVIIVIGSKQTELLEEE